jgi:mitogen-activated protein kinase 1/3
VLDSIFDLIGTPTETDIAFICDQQAANYIRKFTPRPKPNLKEIFSCVSEEGIHLLTQMLQFNPYMRPTVEQCLASPYFDKVRGFSKVINASQQVEMAIEDLTYLSLKDIRVEFNKIINYYEDSKSLNSSDLSVNPINALRQIN